MEDKIKHLIVDYRDNHERTRSWMAQHLGVPPTTLQHWEDNGTPRNWTALLRLLHLTGKTPAELLADAPDEPVVA